MLGQNPIRPLETHDGSQLDVVAIFPTLQGEGPNAGMPSIFIRLGGCNLACDFCDTEFEHFKKMTMPEIMERTQSLRESGATSAIQKKLHGSDKGSYSDKASTHWIASPLARNDGLLCVITGGEPLRQPIAPLCDALLEAGFRVQIETNGTLFRPLPEAVEIVCSPKNTGNGYFPVRDDLLARTNALKFVVSATHPLYRDIADVGQSRTNTPVYIQPMDEYDGAKNAANTSLAIELAKRYNDRFSLQLHKVLGID